MRAVCALNEFLERELLALLSEQAAPSADADGSEESESQSESQSQSQSQWPANVAQLPRPRVLAVSRVCAAEQRLTLVDRKHSLDAFVPQKVLAALEGSRGSSKSGAPALASLRGSLIRVERYHFATPRRVAVLAPTAARWTAPQPRVCLWIDELGVIDESALAVDASTAADETTAVGELLRAMDDDALEARLATRQGLLPLPVAVRFDDAHPLQDEDCVIPEDQEAQLENQVGWGVPNANQPTDSQLIAENESGSWTQSQLRDAEQTPPVMHSPPAQDLQAAVIERVEESELSRGDDESQSVAESQGFQFHPEDVSETFIHCSDDTESESGDAASNLSQTRQNERKRKESANADAASDTLADKENSMSDANAHRVREDDTALQAVPTMEQETAQSGAESMEALEDDRVEEPSPSESQAVDGAILMESQQENTQLVDDIGFPDTQYASQATQGDFVAEMNSEGDFPQTQAPDTADGFVDLDDETTDAAESQTQLPVEEMKVYQHKERPELATKSCGERGEGNVIDMSDDNELPADSEQQQHQPLTQAPDSAAKRIAVNAPPRSRKRTRSAAHSNGDCEAATTPSKAPVVVVIPDTPDNAQARKSPRTATTPSPSRKTRSRAATNSLSVEEAAVDTLPVPQREEDLTAAASSPSPVTAEDTPAAQVKVSQPARSVQSSQEEPSHSSTETSASSPPRQPTPFVRAQEETTLVAARSAKSSPVVSPREPSRSSSSSVVTSLSAAELAVKIYFRTGVPYSIQQRVQQPRDDESLDFFRQPADGGRVAPLHVNGGNHQPRDRSVGWPHARTKQASAKARAGRWRRSELETADML